MILNKRKYKEFAKWCTSYTFEENAADIDYTDIYHGQSNNEENAINIINGILSDNDCNNLIFRWGTSIDYEGHKIEGKLRADGARPFINNVTINNIITNQLIFSSLNIGEFNIESARENIIVALKLIDCDISEFHVQCTKKVANTHAVFLELINCRIGSLMLSNCNIKTKRTPILETLSIVIFLTIQPF